MADRASHIRSVDVIGAGIIGLSCALELADRGVSVKLVDTNWPPRGASWAAAGMLAPAFESVARKRAHPRLYELCKASAELWPMWAKSLEARSGRSSGYHPGPSLAIALSDEQSDFLRSIATALRNARERPTECTDGIATIEPGLTEKIQAAWLLPSDGQADNRLTMSALIACAEAHPRITIHQEQARLSHNRMRELGNSDATLVTAGWNSPNVMSEFAPQVSDLIVPVAGQMLSILPTSGAPGLPIRCDDIYIVPKRDRIVIGATSEPGKVLNQPEAEVIANLLKRATEICPIFENADIIESWAGVRPGTPDHAPLMGKTEHENIFVASGHYRNGILLAPMTAKIMADLITEGESSELANAFSLPARNMQHCDASSE